MPNFQQFESDIIENIFPWGWIVPETSESESDSVIDIISPIQWYQPDRFQKYTSPQQFENVRVLCGKYLKCGRCDLKN